MTDILKNILKSKYVNISVFPLTRERLKNYGVKGESYDLVLNRIIDELEKNNSNKKEKSK